MGKNTSLIWEILRKAVHLSGLLIVIGYTLLLNYFSAKIAVLVMTLVLLILLHAEYIRLEHKPRLVGMLEGLFRKHEKDNISGAVFMVISCIICFSAFDYWVAFLAMFMTVFGDMAAALVGRAWGKIKLLHSKTLEGTLAALVTNSLVGWLILPEFFGLVLIMAITATFVEFITNKLDDNLTVPLFAGFMGQLYVMFSKIELPPIDFTFLGLF
jgi:phytol kinase